MKMAGSMQAQLWRESKQSSLVSRGRPSAPVRGNVPVVTTVALHDVPRVGLAALGPRELLDAQGRGVFGPVAQVGGAVEQPVAHDVLALTSLHVVTREKPQRVALHEHGRVGGVLVADERVARGLELVGEHPAPLLLHAIEFVLRQRDDRAVAREEVLAERLRLARPRP